MRTIPPLIVLLLVGLLGLCPSLALAGDITLSVTTQASVIHQANPAPASGQAEIKVTITNQGNEAANSVSINAQLFKDRKSVPLSDSIAPGQAAETSFSMPVPVTLRDGTYPLFLNILYTHTNGQPVSTASLAVLRTSAEQPPPLVLTLNQGQEGGKNTLTVQTSASQGEMSAVGEITLTCFAPADLTVTNQQRTVRLANGQATTTFEFSTPNNSQGKYAVYAVAETEVDGKHRLTSTSTVVQVAPHMSFFDSLPPHTWRVLGYGATALTLLAWFLHLWSQRQRPQLTTTKRDETINHSLDTLILAAILVFIFAHLSPHSLFTKTVTTGGDTASHYYTVDYLRHVLLPQGKITGWTMGNYAGFPLLQFYFPLPFLLMCLLNAVIPLQIAFKLVSLLGTMLLPIGAYLMLRSLRRPFPAPILAAVFTLPFLFHSANSMWGANILSTLAGEFSYSLSMSLSLILLGCLYLGARQGRWVVGNALLVFLVGFSHGYTLLFVEAVSIFFLITDQGFLQRLTYLVKVYALGFLLLAFWLVPLLVFTKLTTSYHLVWVINSWKEIFPLQVLPFAAITGVGSLSLLVAFILKRRDRAILIAVAYLWFGLIASVVFFIAAPKLGVVDIRYVPYGQLLVALMSALFLGWLVRFFGGHRPLWGLPLLTLIGVFFWVGGAPGPAPDWAKWNYEGFEAKPSWPVFKQINDRLRGGAGDPRVVFEHSEEHNTFGSSRAFESLPLFSGRSTLEGLYMQASISAPFVFYIQSEVSAVNSGPFPQYTYTHMNFQQALPHLRLFNVGNLVIRSDGAKQAIRKAEGYRLMETIGNYELWEVTANSGHYVEPLSFEPVLLPLEHWKTDSYQWFMDGGQLDVPLVFARQGQGPKQVTAKANDLTAPLPKTPIDTSGCQIRETVTNDEIRIDTNWIGKPLLVKVSYHPNWQVEGAEGIALVSPSFMLIYPTQSTVRLHYGQSWPDRLGAGLSLLGLLILGMNLPLFGRRRRSVWDLLTAHLPLPLLGLAATEHPGESPLPTKYTAAKQKIVIAVTTLGALAVAWGCYHIYTSDINRLFNEAVRDKDAKRFEQAIAAFTEVAENQPFSNLAQDARYYIAICRYLDGRDSEAIAAFHTLINLYPKSLRLPEVWYHIGLCQLRSSQEETGVATMNQIIRDFPDSEWAKHAATRLTEKKLPAPTPAATPPLADDSAEGHFGQAIALFNQDQRAQAQAEFEQFLARFPKHPQGPQALACLALIAYKGGDWATTIARYQALIDHHPDHPLAAEAYYHIGLCQDRLGRRDEAKATLQTAADRYPNSTYGQQAVNTLKEW